jgi:hypothetical protein
MDAMPQGICVVWRRAHTAVSSAVRASGVQSRVGVPPGPATVASADDSR